MVKYTIPALEINASGKECRRCAIQQPGRKNSMLQTYGIALLAVLASMAVVFLIALAKRRNDIADVVWGPGFLVVALTVMVTTGNFSERMLLLTGIIAIWAGRLAWHIGLRHVGMPEDSRYARWRKEWGDQVAVRSFFQVFMLQGLLLSFVALPVIAVGSSPASPLGLLDMMGALIWLGGFLIEAIADWQLAQFKRVPANKGRVIMSGLWSWSRHPNYFGEVVLWWGIWIIALSSANGLFALLGPVTITVLLLKVSGIPLLEEKYRTNPEYQDYARRTSIFLPLPPRKEG